MTVQLAVSAAVGFFGTGVIILAGYVAYHGHRYGWQAATPVESWVVAKVVARKIDKEHDALIASINHQ